ncbi:unnamed protein product [Mycena citricolor]|uniref:Glycosyltransferase family 1 protein n=1 Tax=Mycena citricolor TaxID=2018698 RepID=A0AAD2GZK9_9AGAR|nr:unnamed protein product [Mycena citricolor]
MPSRHVLTLLAPSWGHTLPYIHLTTRMLASDPELVITIVQHNLVVHKMIEELSSCSYDTSRLKIEGVGDNEIHYSPLIVETMLKQLTAGWIKVLAKAATEETAWPKPRTLHMDFFGGGFVAKESRAFLGPEGKILVWFSSAATACVDTCSEYDFPKVAQEIYADQSRRAGRTMQEIFGDVLCAGNGSDKLDGRVLEIVGGVRMYDHEHTAQGAGPPRPLAPVLISAQELASLADGFFCPTGTPLEPVTAPLCREYYKKRGQELFLVGPQMHDVEWEAPLAGAGPSDERVKSFLDDAREKFGPKSVLYISFGSLFFPVETPQLVEAMVDVLLSLDAAIPFIFVLAGKMAALPKETIDRIHASGRGIVCAHWVDQKAVLKSGTIGWFLTHGGYNSLTEALSQGIPLIFWPIGAEQAVNAATLSTGPHPIGIELFQMNTPMKSFKAPNITGTIEDAKAEFLQVFMDVKESRGETLKRHATQIGDAWREERKNGEPVKEIARLTRF